VSGEGAQFALVLERIGNDTLEALAGVPAEGLNRAMPLPETNSLFALATHLVGAAEFWVLTLAGGRTVNRDRDAEFSAVGAPDALAARYGRWIADVHAVLDGLPDAQMERIAHPPTAYRGTLPDGEMTVRECLLHAVEHCAIHLGHIQLTRQMQRL
jgi:uncharacterized damage-inducible protein DinB